MTRQWIRQAKLLIGDGGEALDLSDLRFRFHVEQATKQYPEYAEITVTNPRKETAKKVVDKEFTKIVLVAGYPGNAATIFEGEIVQGRYGRESPTDTYLAIIAKGGQKAYSYAVVNKTLAKGHTFRDQIDACLEALKPFGIALGHIAEDLPHIAMPRGRAMWGMVRDHLRSITRTVGASWWVHENKLYVVKNNQSLPGSAVVLNSRTGLIGMPVQTMGGIEARCLLNPEIKPGKRIKIDEASIQRQALTVNYLSEAQNFLVPSIDADGIYKVLKVTHSGDTRGTDWYTDIVCISHAPGAFIPLILSQTGIDTNPQNQ